MESRIAHMLKVPIQVAVGGHFEDVQVVDLLAPSKKQLKKNYRLQQYLTQALLSSQKAFKRVAEGEAEQESRPPAEQETVLEPQAVFAILMASDVDVEACFNEFEKLAAGGCIEINGSSVSKMEYASLDPLDLESIFASYLANFTLPSVMRMFSGS